jgi:Protein of unknown function (DUF3616)
MRHMFSHLKILHLLFLPFSLCLMSLLSCSRTAAPPGGQVLKSMTAFNGGKFDASGVTDVPGTDGVLFVDNGREGQIFWMSLDQNGRQVGEIKTITLKVSIEDIEGITTDGTYFYVVSSQSRPKAIEKAGLVRFKFDARNQSAGEVQSISGLKMFLMENVAELREEGDKKGKDGGLNIEGLAWSPQQNRLLLGLRSPLADGHALLVPLRLRDPRGAFTIDNLEVEGSKAIRLPLGGGGIRGIEYDGRANFFRIISGAAEDQSQTDFGLWEWNGDEKQPVLRETNRFDGSLKPEGVSRVTASGRDFILIVFDAGGYTVLN